LAVKPAWGEHFPTTTVGRQHRWGEGIEDAGEGKRRGREISADEKWIIEP